MFEAGLTMLALVPMGLLAIGLVKLVQRVGVADLLGFGEEPEWLDVSDNALNSRM